MFCLVLVNTEFSLKVSVSNTKIKDWYKWGGGSDLFTLVTV